MERVELGEEILVTRRGKPVVRVVRPHVLMPDGA